jgi:hypothetical protein
MSAPENNFISYLKRVGIKYKCYLQLGHLRCVHNNMSEKKNYMFRPT